MLNDTKRIIIITVHSTDVFKLLGHSWSCHFTKCKIPDKLWPNLMRDCSFTKFRKWPRIATHNSKTKQLERHLKRQTNKRKGCNQRNQHVLIVNCILCNCTIYKLIVICSFSNKL